MAVGPPQVITKLVEGKKCEPYEEAHVEVPQEHMGQVRWPVTWGSARICIYARRAVRLLLRTRCSFAALPTQIAGPQVHSLWTGP